VLAVGGSCFLSASSGAESPFLHQSCHPFSTAMDPLCLELCVNARAPIFTPILLIRIFNTLGKELVILFSLTFASFAPIGVAVFRDLQHLAQANTRELMTILMETLESYRWGTASMLTAFFTLSLSCRNISISRRNFLFSSSIAV